MSPRWLTTIAGLVVCGVWFTTSRIAPPVLPQSGKAFHSPMKAVNFLGAHRPPGNVFNEPQFGDVMIWYMNPLLPVFIDTRFDMYGAGLLADYNRIHECLHGWQSTLDSYGINTVFVSPDCKLAARLSADPAWTTDFTDSSAVVLSRAAHAKTNQL